MAEEHPEWCFLYQYGNDANPRAHYEGTGPEIWRDCPEITHFVAGLGTSGTLMGVGRYLKEQNPDIKVMAVEPPVGEAVEGLRNLDEGFIPPVYEMWHGTELLDGKRIVRPRESHRVDEAHGRRRGVRGHLGGRGARRCGPRRRADRRGRDRLHRLRRWLEVPLAPAPGPTTSTRSKTARRRSSTSDRRISWRIRHSEMQFHQRTCRARSLARWPTTARSGCSTAGSAASPSPGPSSTCLPDEDLVYVGDTGRYPYGPRPLARGARLRPSDQPAPGRRRTT